MPHIFKEIHCLFGKQIFCNCSFLYSEIRTTKKNQRIEYFKNILHYFKCQNKKYVFLFYTLNPNKTGLLKLVETGGGETPYAPKNHFGVSEPPKMYMLDDIHIRTLYPEGQTSSQGPKGKPYTPKNNFGVSEPPQHVHGGGYTH